MSQSSCSLSPTGWAWRLLPEQITGLPHDGVGFAPHLPAASPRIDRCLACRQFLEAA